MRINFTITLLKGGLFVIFLLFTELLTAQNLQISGGHNFSVSLCSNGRIYAWGDNGAGQLGRNPGTGLKYAVASSTVPLEVQLPPGITMRSVDAGSGATGITLGCDGSVWTWGENCNGAIGNGLRGTCGGAGAGTDGDGHYSALQRVVGGDQGGAFLTGIGYINASTTSSFAVETATGRVLAWGNNSNGELGQGNTTIPAAGTYYPRYVKTAAGVDLTNITVVEGSDYGAYALSADGYVYSWGGNSNQDLGRTPAGDQFYARRVQAYDPITGVISDLENIVKITGGDTHGLAIDSDGNLWSWGGDWGPGQRGWGATGAALPYATRVVAPGTPCAYQQWKFGPWITGVVDISAGQQHSIALMDDGRVVTFGNNTHGQIGDGTTTSRGCPVYVQTAAATDLTGVVAISDGDLWSFAINNSGGVYVWGQNNNGQLGISGSTTNQPYATLNPAIPTTCGGSLLPCPIANLGADKLKCLNEVVTLLAGANGDPYRYTWYSGPSATGPWTMIGAANQTYASGGADLDVVTPQYYRVEITDIRNPVSTACGPCPMSSDVIQVTDRTPPLSTSDAGTCGGSVCFEINSTGAIDNNAFDWYADQTTVTKLNASGTTNPFCTSQSNLTLNGSDYEIWVEDHRVFQSTVGPTTVPAGCATPSGSGGGTGSDTYQQQFVAYRDVVMTSVDVYYRTYNVNATPDQVRVTVYSNDPNKNSSSNDGVNTATGLVSTTVNIPRTSTNFQLFTLSGLNLPLTGSAAGTKYWLEITPVGGSNGTFGAFTCAASYPYSDAVVGEDVLVLRGSTESKQVIQQATFKAVATNWNFTYQGGYPCGRFKLTAPAGNVACLPVEFLYFRGENKGSYNILSWATGWEQNSSYFEIQKSYDGVNWGIAGTVKAAGNSTSVIEYSFNDKISRNGVTYYRIEEKDHDGMSTFSKVISLNSQISADISLKPNPTNGRFTVEAVGITGDAASITIYDAVGKLVYYSSENFLEGSLSKEISLSQFGKGIYFVIVSGDGYSNTEKLIIE